MLPRAVLLRRLPRTHPAYPALRLHQRAAPITSRFNSTTPTSNSSSQPSSSSSSTPTTPSVNGNGEKKSWLTRKVEASPAAKSLFLGVAKAMGYGSPKQLAARRAFVLYEKIAAVRPEEDVDFWQKACYLPPTFQSWFTITNLHIWMLTVRLRALPAEHGKHYIQALIDHFFIDIEDRIRAVLQPKEPAPPPYTFTSTFYVNPNAPSAGEVQSGKRRKLGGAPDRIVNRQMKIFKEQWAGMGLSLDLAMVQGDQEMAAAVWRNLLGARGAQGIEYPVDNGKRAAGARKFTRRAVNLVGGEVVNVEKLDVAKEEGTDDESGVSDFLPEEVDKYLTYPEVMLDLTRYVRRELARLDKVSDEDIMEGNWEALRFGDVVPKKGRKEA